MFQKRINILIKYTTWTFEYDEITTHVNWFDSVASSYHYNQSTDHALLLRCPLSTHHPFEIGRDEITIRVCWNPAHVSVTRQIAERKTLFFL